MLYLPKVFLGGTCNESTWRDDLIPLLQIAYFNPVVEDWTEKAQKEELDQREICDYCLYCITPRMTGVYAIAEAVDDSNKRPRQVIFCVLEKDGSLNFTDGQIKSLNNVKKMVKRNGGKTASSLRDVADMLNRN